MNSTFLNSLLDSQFDLADIADPEIVIGEEHRAKFPHAQFHPDVSIIFRVGGSEGADVTIDLLDTGNDEDGVKQYDADLHVGNDDSTGPKYMLLALAACLDKFYALGLHTRFGAITGDHF